MEPTEDQGIRETWKLLWLQEFKQDLVTGVLFDFVLCSEDG